MISSLKSISPTIKKYEFNNPSFLLSFFESLINSTISLKVPLEVSQILKRINVKALQIEDSKKELFNTYLSEYLFLRRLTKTKDWSKKWVQKVIELDKKYGLDIQISNTQEKIQTSKIEAPGLMEYIYSSLSKSKTLLQLSSFVNQYSPIMTQEVAFCNMNYLEGADTVFSKDESFFLNSLKLKNCVLTPHLTSFVTHAKELGVLDFSKVYRRETVDKTHLCEFYQLEYLKKAKTNDPPAELKKDLLIIFNCLGLDIEKLIFKSTRFNYTSPSFEVFYQLDDHSIIELGGCGLMVNEVIKPSKKEETVYLAAGIGLERCYGISHNISNISKIYPLLIHH